MLTCREASFLISQGQDRTMRPLERVNLRVHLWMCGNCRRYEQQMRLFRMALDRLARSEDLPAHGSELSLEAYERIRRTLAGR